MSGLSGTAWVRANRADLEALPAGKRRDELLAQHRTNARPAVDLDRVNETRERIRALRAGQAALDADLGAATEEAARLEAAVGKLTRQLGAVKTALAHAIVIQHDVAQVARQLADRAVPTVDTPELIAIRRAAILEDDKGRGAA